MLNPLIPYAIKGVIWYQGEANGMTGNYANNYGELMRDLVTIWREKWDNPTLPFYYVQLANFEVNRSNKAEIGNNWAKVRDQQRLSLKIPKTGMAVITDIGQADNIHPKNKQDVGKRLALWALAKTYHQDIKVYSGTLVNSATAKNNRIVVNFSHTGSGLMCGSKILLNDTISTSQPLNTFEIQDNNGNWYPAQATIVNQHEIAVSKEEIPKVTAVRYAWSINPSTANLYNNEGLPASAFSIKVNQ